MSRRNHLCDHTSFVCLRRSQRLRVEQKRLSTASSGAVAPSREDAIAWNDAGSKVWQIMEGSRFLPQRFNVDVTLRGVFMTVS